MNTKSAPAAPGERIPGWVAVIVIVGALLSLVGAAMSKLDPALLTTHALTDAARVYTDYTFARNLSVGLTLLGLLALRSRCALAGVMTLVALIQIFDVLDDLMRGDFMLAAGLLVFIIALLVGAQRLLGAPLWRAAAWRGA
ncbi:MAG TPA: hypothetical protein VIC27_09280 [Ktedonobacterales bacterium]